MNTLEIAHRWADVQSSPGYNYFYPDPVSRHMKIECCGPAVYRWMVWTPGDRIYAYYIGETDDLARRIRDCVHPGRSQQTNIRLKAYFDEAVNQKRRVEVQKWVFEPFQLNNAKFSMEMLAHTLIRRP